MTLEITITNFSLDANNYLVQRPGNILAATNDINIVENGKEALYNTFVEKAKKVLPETKIRDMTDHFARGPKQRSDTPTNQIIGIVFRTSNTRWLFEGSEKFDKAAMIFIYRGFWATFQYDSTIGHVRKALNAWKKEMFACAKAKGLNVKRCDDMSERRLPSASARLKNDEILMLFANKKLDSFYTKYKINKEEWPCILLDANGNITTFDKTVSKAQIFRQETDTNNCLSCGKKDQKNRCLSCKKEFMCDQCRETVYKSFEQGENHNCLACGQTQPIYVAEYGTFAVYSPAVVTNWLQSVYGIVCTIREN